MTASSSDDSLRLRLRKIDEVVYEVPRSGDMRVPARVFTDDRLLGQVSRDRSIEQLVNVTTLPGIVGAAMGMPDMHEGYGFPVGGVAATLLPDGVISPGGIGFDINCGVRLLASRLDRGAVSARAPEIIHELSRSIPSGFGRGGKTALGRRELDRILDEGVPCLVREHGLGEPADLDHIESGGALPGADSGAVSDKARERGRDQLGTLGSGNHFIELQWVDHVYDDALAAILGLRAEQVVILVHSGSRGLGHQVCTDYVREMDRAMARFGIALPDRQLACAPLSSPEGKRYLGAMAAAANFGFANRQAITEKARRVFERFFGGGVDAYLRLVYDLAHNTAKIEELDGQRVCVHRKGATRAFGPSSPEIPARYRGAGQPVFIPGSMGTASYVLVGTDRSSAISLSSACHGAGRAMSRGAAKRAVSGHELRRELAAEGIHVHCPSAAELAEEAPLAYKDVDQVVEVVARAGIAKKVARLRPMGVVKG